MFSLIRAYKRYDPAAKSFAEILFLYPGVKAVGLHRIAHLFYRLRLYFLARLISETNRLLTGIDIHPGATLGKRVIIDHGHGVVIGETAIVGNDVIIYQGASLGGTNLNPVPRHPRVEDHVVIGAGAKILGHITIGCGSRIGANSVVVKDVPKQSTVVGIPGRVVEGGVHEGDELCHDKILEGSGK